jgi:hypothetical protein
VIGIGVALPLTVGLPGDHQALRWLPDQHPAPVTFGAVDTALEPASAFPGLQDGLGHLGLAVVIIRGHQLPNELVNTRNACSTGTLTVTLPLISGTVLIHCSCSGSSAQAVGQASFIYFLTVI